MWVQTSRYEFETGELSDVDTIISPGDVRLATPSDWYHSDWICRRSINIDHTKVPDVADPAITYAEFPVLVYMTGLSGVLADGADIRFTSSDGVTELPGEIEHYSDGTLYAWAKTTLTRDSGDSSDDIIYMYYGNGSATEPDPASAYGSENIWDTNFVLVQHLEETSGSHYDSTSYANNTDSPLWVAVGGTSPVTGGLPPGRYLQWRATLNTSDPNNTPTLHEVVVYYD
jgi:hypothetical protein